VRVIQSVKRWAQGRLDRPPEPWVAVRLLEARQLALLEAGEVPTAACVGARVLSALNKAWCSSHPRATPARTCGGEILLRSAPHLDGYEMALLTDKGRLHLFGAGDEKRARVVWA
jgi:hypothetical protein